MRITFERTIVVEFTLSDDQPLGMSDNQYDELTDSPIDAVIRDEKNMLLSSWMKQTEYALMDDTIIVKTS